MGGFATLQKSLLGLSFCLSFSFYCISKTVCSVIAYIIFNRYYLLEGEEAVIESPSGAFEPFVVHYAETFIIPACAKEYTIRPYGKAEGKECVTIKAYVRF